MSEENENNIGGFDDDNGEKLDIKKNQDTTNEFSKEQTMVSPSSTGMKIAAYFFLTSSAILFIVGAFTTPWLAVGGGACCLISIFCIGAAMYQDYQQSKLVNSSYMKNSSINTSKKTNSIENSVTMMTDGHNYSRIPIHNVNDFSNKQRSK